MKLPIAILTGPPVPGTRLGDDLRALGFTIAVAEGHAALAAALAGAPPGERVAVIDPRFTGHRHSLRLALTDPRYAAAAVPGAVTVPPSERHGLSAALTAETGRRGDEVAGRPPRGRLAAGVPTVPAAAVGTPCVPDLLAARLQAGGTPVHRPELGPLVATVPATRAERERAEAARAATDEEAVRLSGAVKSRDGFFTTHCVSPYSRYLARWCARQGLTPNQVTTASLLTALAAAGCAATGARPGFLAAGLLLLASFVLDCADGQLARYSLRFSTLGAWLDATFDRVKEYAFYAGLALGAARGGDDVWGLALAAMALQTCRHVVDFSFSFAARRDGTGGDGAGGDGAAAGLSGRLDRIGWTVWLRRMIVLPIGERWALIAVLTAAATPRVTFTVLLLASGFATCYTTAGRLLRSLPALRRNDRLPAGAALSLAALADTGPLGAALGRLGRQGRAREVPPGPRRHPLAGPLWALTGVALLPGFLLLTGTAGGAAAVVAAALYALCAGRAAARPGRPLDRPLDWLLPPLFRVGEYATVLLLAVNSGVNGALPAAYAVVAACAYHHYDTVYRLRGGAGAPPRWLGRVTGGHEGRALAVTATAALWADGQGFTVALAVLATTMAALVLAESIRFWAVAHAPALHDETGVPG